jgi:hypothetical protein
MTRRGVASTPPWPKAGLSETSPAGGLRMLTSTWMANATASVLRLTKAPSHSTLASVQLRVVNPDPVLRANLRHFSWGASGCLPSKHPHAAASAMDGRLPRRRQVRNRL